MVRSRSQSRHTPPTMSPLIEEDSDPGLIETQEPSTLPLGGDGSTLGIEKPFPKNGTFYSNSSFSCLGSGSLEPEPEEDQSPLSCPYENFMSLDDDDKDWKTKWKSIGKLVMILGVYSYSFITLIWLGLWFADTTRIKNSSKLISVPDWVKMIWLSDRDFYQDKFLQCLVKDSALLILFGLQHSFLTSRNLKEYPALWYNLKYVYNVHKILYILSTGLVVHLMISFWEPIPVEIWSIEFLSENWIKWIHITSWTLIYGTSVMLDLPDMIGLTEVVIQSPTLTQKSPELQKMYEIQRHMGFLPFMLITFGFPFMTLDRLLIAICLLFYTYHQWNSETCYQYTNSMRQVKKKRLSS